MARTRKTLSPEVTKKLEAAESLVDVARKSKQKRYTKKKEDVSNFFWNIYSWVHSAELEEPNYQNDSRTRDKWLREFVMREPFLNGVLANVVSIDVHRGWNLIGGERSVKKHVGLLHRLHAAPDQIGWRPFISTQSASYHCADIGTVSEIEWNGNKFNSLYATDPGLCKLTGERDYPLEFNDPNGDVQRWSLDGYFRIVDSPSTDENMRGLGVCAISRALELAKIMVALYDHDKEKLLAKAPKGLLLIKGISQEQWVETMENRDLQMSALERKYYQGVQVFASMTDDIQASLVSLSQIPEGLDHDTFTNIIMYLYALAFKYDPREFWPVSGGQLGTATETEVQHRKATGKGGLDFSMPFQEKIQDLLPETVEFEFEARDVEGERADEALKGEVIGNILKLLTAVDAQGTTLITPQQARMLLAESEIIPKEWAEPTTMVATDEEDTPASTLETAPTSTTLPATDFFTTGFSTSNVFFREAVHRNLYYFPNEPIMRYRERNGIGQWETLRIPPAIKRSLTQHKLISIAKPKEGSTTRARFFSLKKIEEEKGVGTLGIKDDPEK